MKQVWPNYSYSPATNVLTLTGLNIDRDQLLLVAAPERGRIMYNFADSSVTASSFTSGANTSLTLVASTSGLTTTASLVIYYDDQLQGNSVTISSLPAISGTVTANVPNLLISETSVANGIQIFAYNEDYNQSFALRSSTSDIGALRVQPISLPAISGTVTANLGSAISGTVTANLGSALPTGTNRIGVVTIGAGTVTIGAGTAQIGSVTASISNSVTIASLPAISGTVTIGNTVTIAGTVTANPTGTQTVAGTVAISSLPAISGTVTANTFTNLDWIYVAGSFTKTAGSDTTPTLYLNTYFKRDSKTTWSSWSYPTNEDNCTATIYNVIIDDRAHWKLDVNYYAFGGPVGSAVGTLARFTLVSPSIYSEIPPKTGWFINTDDGFAGAVSVSYEQPYVIPISGTVTVGNSVTVSSLPVSLSTTTIGGTARLNVTLSSATTIGATAPSYGNLYGGSDGTNLRAISVDASGRTVVTGTISILGTPTVTMGAISGTVTANNPNGTLTTQFGSVTTGGTSQLTACVTNSARKYLFCQNISTATVTIGIGFSPTTTRGIQLTAGGGITFDAFCPTGGVWWLGATNANYTILEG